jgi:hypothetical protein
MATRSTIAVEQADGRIRSIYCHWDGYPDGVGATLENYYTDERKIEKLLDLGDLSVLGENIGQKQDFDNRTEGSCLFYGRDRGETGIDSLQHDSVTEWLNSRIRSGCEYGYLWDGKRWNTYPS